MKTINYESYVSHEVAKLLKKVGFDCECETCYIGKSTRPYKYHNFFNWNMPRKYFEKDGSNNLFHAFITQKKTNIFISAPTLEVAQGWLRDVKRLFICIIPEIKDYKATWNFYICNEQGFFYENENCFLTYEEAKEAGIKKALEIILEKGK